MQKYMQAICIYQYGDYNVLKENEVPCPMPDCDQILIGVHAIGVNPIDYKTRQGDGVAWLLGEKPFPLILGWDVSGVVESAPQNTNFTPGDPVFGLVGFPKPGSTYAEYAVARPNEIACAPYSIDLITAASVPLASLAAWQALIEIGRVQTGQSVLIHAAAGGVGHIAVQLAKWRGAHVIGTASTRNVKYLAGIGVDQFIDYNRTCFEEATPQVDIVLDTVGGETLQRSYGVVKKGGKLISIVDPPITEKTKAYNIEGHYVFVSPNSRQLSQIADLIDAGVIKPNVEQRLPMFMAGQAHRLLESRHVRGKIVLTP